MQSPGATMGATAGATAGEYQAMSGITNVIRKHGTYYFRRVIRLGSAKPFRLRLSLRTTCRNRARLLASALTLSCERVTMNMMSGRFGAALTSEQSAEIFRRQMLIERDRLEVTHAVLHIQPAEDHADSDKAMFLRLGASELAAQDGIAKGKVDDFVIARIDPDADDEPVVLMAWSDLAASMEQDAAEDAAIARLGDIGLEPTPLRAAMARKVVHQARIVAVREYRNVLENPEAAYPTVPVAGYGSPTVPYTLVPPQLQPQPSTPRLAAGSPEVAAGPWATMRPTEAVEKFFHYNPRTGGADGTVRKRGAKPWTEKTRNQCRVAARLLDQVMQGRPLSTVTHDDLVNLDACFARLHGPSYGKSPRHGDMTIWEIVAEAEERVRLGRKLAEAVKPAKKGSAAGAAKLKPLQESELGLELSTTNRHWGYLQQLTKWFEKHHPLAPLDFKAFSVTDTRDPRELGFRYTVEQGKELFRLPPFTGSQSYTRRMRPGSLMVHSAWYFVPIIAWYTGARREEICGLKLSEIREIDGLWQFDFQPTEIRQLKTVTSRRSVPFADELVRLRLPEYVMGLREAGETLLFPELVAESGIGNMGDAYYKNVWTKIATALPWLKKGQANHSFRHTLVDAMKEAGVPSEIRADFVGHKLNSETEGRYSNAHVKLLREAAKAIPIVTEHLEPFPLTLLPPLLRAPRKARPGQQKPRH